jgi:hypothetical protein
LPCNSDLMRGGIHVPLVFIQVGVECRRPKDTKSIDFKILGMSLFSRR